ncbi:nucleotide exchange factor GrpE [Actinomadura scrupuli]|uniref:nucleotide exchange factor GrpE n=1 Tax=Actinomadura scrupuli TaxID=559629 RepID=UPI003D980089
MSSAQDPPSDDDVPPAEDDFADGPSSEPPAPTLSEIQSALSGLVTVVEREHERAAHREAIIDRLHEDNQLLRRGELQALHEPVRNALYRLHDMVKREAVRWASAEPPDPAHAAALLSAVTDEIAEALARTGVERFTVKPGDPFDPARHRPVGSEPVTDPGLDGTVMSVLTDGFEKGEQVMRRSEVRIGKLQNNPE